MIRSQQFLVFLLLAFLAYQQSLASEPFLFDPDGSGDESPVQAGAWDWTPDNLLITSAIPATSSGSHTLTFFHGSLSNLNDSSGRYVTVSGLGQKYELTFVAGFEGLGHKFSQVPNLFFQEIDSSGSVNFFRLYWDPNRNASISGGTGYNDGLLILSSRFESFDLSISARGTQGPLDEYLVDDHPGQKSVVQHGAAQGRIQVTSYNPAFFPNGGPAVIDINTGLWTPYRQTEPTAAFVDADNRLVVPNLGKINGQSGPDIQLQTDVNMSMEAGTCRGEIGDYVWHDANRNGIQDPGEEGINGVTVILTDENGRQMKITTANGGTSNRTGYYSFQGLCAGNYMIAVDTSTLPEGMVPTKIYQGENSTIDSDYPYRLLIAIKKNKNITIDFGFVVLCQGEFINTQ